jgi:hypothetical protein
VARDYRAARSRALVVLADHALTLAIRPLRGKGRVSLVLQALAASLPRTWKNPISEVSSAVTFWETSLARSSTTQTVPTGQTRFRVWSASRPPPCPLVRFPSEAATARLHSRPCGIELRCGDSGAVYQNVAELSHWSHVAPARSYLIKDRLTFQVPTACPIDEMIPIMETMSMTEISRIARTAAGRTSPQLNVVGVTINAGGSDYVEIVVDVRGCHRESCQILLGVFRNVTEGALEAAISDQLRQHLAAHQPDGTAST